MSGPLVTIVTPSFNQGRFIRATIESVLTQDYPNIEYIVMDGGSTDETAQVVSEYGSRLRFVSEPDRGQTHAINKGFQQARGPVVAYLNSDDTLLPGAVAKAVAALEAHPGAGAIYGDGYQIDEAGAVRQRFPFTEPFNLWKLTYLLDYVLQQTVFFRRECVEQLGWLNESLHFGMDWDILVRLGKRYGLVYVPELLGCLREYETAKSFAGGERRFRELAGLLRAQTGERFPPGWWFYGLDTYDKIWFRRCKPFLGEAAAQRIVHLCRARIDSVQRHSQGYYTDGWAGRTLHWMLPMGHGAFAIRGTVPDWSPRFSGQAFRVRVNGREAATARTGTGAFELRVPLPGGGAPVIRIDASAAVRPPGDARRLAWQVSAIEPCR